MSDDIPKETYVERAEREYNAFRRVSKRSKVLAVLILLALAAYLAYVFKPFALFEGKRPDEIHPQTGQGRTPTNPGQGDSPANPGTGRPTGAPMHESAAERWIMHEGNFQPTDWHVNYEGRPFACNIGGIIATCTATKSDTERAVRRIFASDKNFPCDFTGTVTATTSSISGSYRCPNGDFTWRAEIVAEN